MSTHLSDSLRTGHATTKIAIVIACLLVLSVVLYGAGRVSADHATGNQLADAEAEQQVAPAADASLGSLALTADGNAVALTPAFDPEIAIYHATVTAENVAVQAGASRQTATISTITIEGETTVQDPASDMLDATVPIVEGAVTRFSFPVLAADGETTRTYRIDFQRPAADTVPDITLGAIPTDYVAGLENLVFTLTRQGDITDSLDVTLNLEQTQDWLSTTSHTVTFAAGDAATTRTFTVADFSLDATPSGDLVATVARVDGYDTSAARVQVRVFSEEGPSIWVSIEQAEYTFAEDAGEVEIPLVARVIEGIPYVPDFSVSVSSSAAQADSETGDYLALSETVRFDSLDFREEAGELVGRKTVSFTILDDNVSEGDEYLFIHLARSPGVSEEVSTLDAAGDDCNADCTNPYRVTIADNDEDQVALGTDASLGSLTLTEDGNAVALTPAFDPEVTRYEATVNNASVVVAAYATRNTAKIDQTTVGSVVTAQVTPSDGLATTVATAEGAITDFSLRVRAEDGVTTRTYRIAFSRPVAPGTPTGLTAWEGGPTLIDLEWTAPASDGGSEITGYKIEVSANGTSNWTDLDANTGNTDTAYWQQGLAANTTRYYRVSAINSVGAGTPSNVANATTATDAPTRLWAEANGSSQIDLEWAAPLWAAPAEITGYKIEVSPNGALNWTNLDTNTGTTDTTYSHRGLSSGATRHYRVSAITSAGASAASNVASATTSAVPGAPTGLTATADGPTEIYLSWTAPANTGGSWITGYRIEVSSDGGATYTDLVANTGTSAVNGPTAYAHTGLADGDTRHYRVSAIDYDAGPGPPSNVASATTTDVIPFVRIEPDRRDMVPEGIGSVVLTVHLDRPAETALSVAWRTQDLTAESPADFTAVVENTNGGTLRFAAGQTRKTVSVRIVNDRERENGPKRSDGQYVGEYFFVLIHPGPGYRPAGYFNNEPGSSAAMLEIDDNDGGASAPGAPYLRATANGTTAIDLSWITPEFDGRSAITGYKIEVSTDGGSNYTDLVVNTGTADTTYSHTGLAAATTRHYRVSAINSVDTGYSSNVADATTDG